jgi:hypothetical protein
MITNMNVAYLSTLSTLIISITSRLYECVASIQLSDTHRRPAVFCWDAIITHSDKHQHMVTVSTIPKVAVIHHNQP